MAQNVLHSLAKIKQTPVSLKQMVQFGPNPSPFTLFKGAQFLKHELPIRLAHRIVELSSLPHDLSKMPSVTKVSNWYTQSANELLEFPDLDIPKCKLDLQNLKYYHPTLTDEYDKEMLEYNQKFIQLIDNIKKRHAPTTEAIAKGILEVKSHWKESNPKIFSMIKETDLLPIDIQQFLDNFYMSRIGFSVKAKLGKLRWGYLYKNKVFEINRLADVLEDAIIHSQMVCQDYFTLFEPPKVRVIGLETIKTEFMYVPSHLHHMIFELLKNSMRAVVEMNPDLEDQFPEIRMVVAEGKEDITIKISDEGGGISRSGMPLIWTYLYTTAESSLLDQDHDEMKAPLAGYGYGLPLSRLYARYFGGDLRLISMEGYGTDAYLHLSRLSDSTEPLP